MEGYCSTGQSPQWVVVPMEKEEEEEVLLVEFFQKNAPCEARNAVLRIAPRKQTDERGMAVEITNRYKNASMWLDE